MTAVDGIYKANIIDLLYLRALLSISDKHMPLYTCSAKLIVNKVLKRQFAIALATNEVTRRQTTVEQRLYTCPTWCTSDASQDATASDLVKRQRQ